MDRKLMEDRGERLHSIPAGPGRGTVKTLMMCMAEAGAGRRTGLEKVIQWTGDCPDQNGIKSARERVAALSRFDVSKCETERLRNDNLS